MITTAKQLYKKQPTRQRNSILIHSSLFSNEGCDCFYFVRVSCKERFDSIAALAPRWSNKLLIGVLLLGFGILIVVEGTIDHHLLGIHHVNETVPPEQWIYWGLGFLAWGAAMLIGGWALLRTGQEQTHENRLRGLSVNQRLKGGCRPDSESG
jgi:predicted membrane protein DUF2243